MLASENFLNMGNTSQDIFIKKLHDYSTAKPWLLDLSLGHKCQNLVKKKKNRKKEKTHSHDNANFC